MDDNPDDIIAESLLDEKKIAEKKQSDQQKQEIIEVHPIVEYEDPDDDSMSDEEMEHNARSYLQNYFRFKTEYALIVFGNDVQFAHKYDDDNGDESFVVKKKNSVRDEWADRKAFVQVMNQPGEIKYIPVDVTFLAIEGSASFPGVTEFAVEYGKPMKRWQGISFCPNDITNVSYNRYRGFSVEPQKGDVTPLLEFLEKAFGKEGKEIILIFFASMYQFPEVKLRWMLSLIGEKGLGKNTVEELLGQKLLYSENYVRAGNKDHLFNKFNAIFEANLLTVAQEIIWDGNQKHDSILKEWVTESTRTIERKFVDPYTVGNYSRILMTSNADRVVPAAGKEERRYAVLRVKDIGYKPKDWEKLYLWAEENKGAIMDYLLHYPLKDNYHSRAPHTEELINQLRQGLDGIETYVFDGISNGFFGKPAKFDREVGEINVTDNGIAAKRMFYSYMQTRDTKEKLVLSEFGRKLAGATGSKSRLLSFNTRRVGKEKTTTYVLGARKECAKVFYQATGVKIYLNESDSEWLEHE